MKINIASTHRFHLLDLARELSRLGHDVVFYSYVPNKRCQKFGLPKTCSRSMLFLALPFFFMQKIFGNKPWITKYRNILLDNYLSYFMRPCDIYIGLGTAYLKSFKMAKKRFNAVTILEWGSKHIDEQQRILKMIGAPTNVEYFNQRSRDAYEEVDYISIATQHVLDSFLKHGFKREKFLVNPYGVDLSMFSYIPREKTYDVIMVGNWSYQKGCDLIVDAIKHSDYKFLHVGSIVDCPFPKDDKRFTQVDAVDQPKLNAYYNQAKVFVLPSRQEGLAMVQAQAIACHLPLIGSKDSGAVDLQQMVDKPNYITIVQEHTWQAVLAGIKKSLNAYESLGDRGYAGGAIKNLTWKAYGERYERFVKLLESKNLDFANGGVTRQFDFIMVGGWSYRKGCDIIVEAIRKTNYKFLHVGSIVDLPFPNSSQFVHFDSVNQDLLMFFYNMAKASILPSREEGLAMVQAQALACGLPLIGSKDSGAEEFLNMLGTKCYISILSDYNVKCLVDEMDKCMEYVNHNGDVNAGVYDLSDFSWSAYAMRYNDFITMKFYD